MDNNQDDFHFDDIDAFCREDINSLIDKALGLKKEKQRNNIFDDNNVIKKPQSAEILDFECIPISKLENKDIEIMDFDDSIIDNKIETLDFSIENKVEELTFNEEEEIENLVFELENNELNEKKEVVKNKNTAEYLNIQDDIDSAVNHAFSEELIQEPEFFDFDLEEMESIEVLDDSFFRTENDERDSNKIDIDSLKKKILIIILILMVVALIFVIYKIFRWKFDNDSIKKQVSNIHSYVNVETIDDNKNTVIVDEKNENLDDKLINVNFDELKNSNSDTVAWIKVEGTNIDYPVVQTIDNKYYLTHSFDKNYNEAGWVFADYRNNLVDDRNLVIYGHARLNETMFGSLKNVIKSFWYENSDNYVIKLSTPTVNSSWQVFSTYTIPAEDYYITTDFIDNTSFYEFIKILRARSVYDYNVELTSNDRILTLSTCYSDNKRVVLHAKLIKYETKRQ